MSLAVLPSHVQLKSLKCYFYENITKNKCSIQQKGYTRKRYSVKTCWYSQYGLKLSVSVSIFSSGLPHRTVNQGGELQKLSAVPRCLEKARGLFNSQPIFCPSHYFILILELSSGPQLSRYDISYSLHSDNSRIYCQLLCTSAHFQYDQQIKFSNWMYLPKIIHMFVS